MSRAIIDLWCSDGRDCPHSDRPKTRRDCYACLDDSIAKAITTARAEGRAAGYAEAVERAARFMRKREEAHIVNIKKWGQAGDERAESASIQLASECAIAGDAIRALAPAKEEP